MYVLFALAITQFNLEIHAKVKHQDAIDLKVRKVKTFYSNDAHMCHVCDLLDSLYSMGNNCIITQSINISMSNTVYYGINSIMILVASALRDL